MKWNVIPDEKTIQVTAKALNKNGIKIIVAKDREEAKKQILSLIPPKSEVMTMTSLTLDAIDVTNEINNSGKYVSVRNKLSSLDRKTQSQEMNKLGAAPEFVLGSVHAVTAEGHVLIASKTGSQIPAYVSGAAHVIWAVGAQKIVKNIEEGMKRIYEYCLPLEDKRARKAYGVGSSVNKILILKKEIIPDRITMILIKENLGF